MFPFKFIHLRPSDDAVLDFGALPPLPTPFIPENVNATISRTAAPRLFSGSDEDERDPSASPALCTVSPVFRAPEIEINTEDIAADSLPLISPPSAFADPPSPVHVEEVPDPGVEVVTQSRDFTDGCEVEQPHPLAEILQSSLPRPVPPLSGARQTFIFKY